ncbi:MAG: hypothetical protein CVT48_03380 [Thermoplasmata archaeon HGW-Thermoplasmata-1]|nr:MAG: hypothetical protein CVT48_03380 [Thermoplasmata archaeon HGW-Thermoplasmata-1]
MQSKPTPVARLMKLFKYASADAHLMADIGDLISVFNLLLPALLFIAVMWGYSRHRGMFERLGFSSREVGLLIVGSLIAMSINLPLFAIGSSLLAINLGGAIIPVVLSIYFITKRKLPALQVIFGILIVSLVTFLVTRVEHNVGITAEFPFYLLPPALSVILAMAFFSRNSEKAPPYAYSIATLGVLIGADVYHLPELLGRSFVGSVGGAGVFDMVFISGLLALVVDLIFVGSKLRRSEHRPTPDEQSSAAIKDSLYAAGREFSVGNYSGAVRDSLAGINEKIKDVGRRYGRDGDPYEMLCRMTSNPELRADYSELVRTAFLMEVSREESYRIINTSRAIGRYLVQLERAVYATTPSRIAAFIVDMAIMVLILGSIIPFMNRIPESEVEYQLVAMTWFMLVWAVQVVYFTLCETFWGGRTVGKYLLGIRSANMDGSRLDFLGAFTRNVVRFLDALLLSYLVSIIIMESTFRRQRIGDLVGRTVVVRDMRGRRIAGGWKRA